MSDTAVLVSSCDRYRDLWKPFFTLFFRYWPDCPYPVHLLSNHETYDDPRVSAITVGEDRDWSSSFRRALEGIPRPNVIVLMEDYLFTERIDTARIEALVAVLEKRKAACLRLYPCPGPDGACADEPGIGEIRKGADYRLSLQAAIWDRRTLAGLVRDGETAWQLELQGSRRTDELEAPFLSVVRDAKWPLPYFCTAVVMGRWLREAVRLCRKEGIEPDLRARPCESWWRYFRRVTVPACREKLRRVAGKPGRREQV